MRRPLHDGARHVDGMAGGREPAGRAGGAVAEHDAAVHLGAPVERERGAAARVEARLVLHHMHSGNDGLERAGPLGKKRVAGVDGPCQRGVGLRPLLGRHLVQAPARAAVDNEERPLSADLQNV